MGETEHAYPLPEEHLFHPATNTLAGTWYLRKVLRRYVRCDHAVPFALADYNAGRGNVLKWAQGPAATNSAAFLERIGFPGTRAYVEAIIKRRVRYRGDFRPRRRRTHLNRRMPVARRGPGPPASHKRPAGRGSSERCARSHAAARYCSYLAGAATQRCTPSASASGVSASATMPVWPCSVDSMSPAYRIDHGRRAHGVGLDHIQAPAFAQRRVQEQVRVAQVFVLRRLRQTTREGRFRRRGQLGE